MKPKDEMLDFENTQDLKTWALKELSELSEYSTENKGYWKLVDLTTADNARIFISLGWVHGIRYAKNRPFDYIGTWTSAAHDIQATVRVSREGKIVLVVSCSPDRWEAVRELLGLNRDSEASS